MRQTTLVTRVTLRLALVLLLAAAVLLSSVAAGVVAGEEDARPGWTRIFNGRDLSGWQVKITGHELGDNYADTFRVADGKLVVAYDRYETFGDRFGHLCYQRKLSRYRLRLEYRIVGEQAPGGADWAFKNSGIMIHSQSAASMMKDQDFPISIEVQLLGGAGLGERPTANLCTPGTHVEMAGRLVTEHCINSDSPTFHGEEWVAVEVEVHGGERIVHKVNGETVLSYEKPQIGGGVVNGFDPAVKQDGKLLTEGYLCLQAESHPFEFREIELLELPRS